MLCPHWSACFVHTWCSILWLQKTFWSSTSPTSIVKTHGPGLDHALYVSWPSWLHNYLANRRQSVVVNGTTSESSHAISGVPQGSVLGPLVFLIYIDDITNGPFSPGTHMVLYAEDILLHRIISSNSDYSYLQSGANIVQDWVNYNHMFLNPSKWNSCWSHTSITGWTTLPL